MTVNGRRISWVYTVLLFHAAVPDRTLSTTTVTGARTTGKALLESKAAPASWFQHWTINSGQIVPGEFATIPGAFKYSAMVEVDNVRCSAVVISARWVLSSTHCFSSESGGKTSTKTRAGGSGPTIIYSNTSGNQNRRKTSTKTKAGGSGPTLIYSDTSANLNPDGYAYAGGIKYKAQADFSAHGVQRQELEALLLYTESRAEAELRMHDIMLVRVGPAGFRFDKFVQPIRLTDQRRFSLGRPRTCIVVGYGDNNYETITLASLLEKCEARSEAENAVCVDEFRWPCLGDAGAPLVCQNMLVGTLRSEGLLPNSRCVKFAQHTVKNFTFVGYYRDWIVEHAVVQFGVWHSGSRGRYASPMSRGRGASYAVMLLLDIGMYVYLK